MTRVSRALLFLGFCSGWAVDARARDQGLFDLSLAELGEVKVTVASVKAESIARTPAVVSSYSRAEMVRLGLHTLKDLLSFMPGVMANDGTGGNTYVSMRGLHEDFNQKILFLLDDTPYWQTSRGDCPILGIPVEAIDHVEVIRGPGAVNYGSNASAGVIKVVTRKDAGNVVAGVLGGNDKHKAGGYLHHQWGEDHDFTLSAETQREDGYSARSTDYRPATGKLTEAQIDRKELVDAMLARYHNGGLVVLANAFKTEKTGLQRLTNGAGTAQRISPLRLKYEAYLLHADYSWSTNSWEFNSFAERNLYTSSLITYNDFGDIDSYSESQDKQDDYRDRYGLTAYFAPAEEPYALHLGVESETRSISESDQFNLATDELTQQNRLANTRREQAGFAQVDYTLGDMRILAGVRLTDNELYGSQLTPRYGVVYSLDEHQSVKLLHTTGFNSPNFRQTDSLAGSGLTGNPDLQPETVSNTDLVYTYERNGLLAVANAYYVEGQDFIVRTPSGAPTSFENGEPFSLYGLELDIQYRRDSWLLMLNGATTWHRDEVQERDEYNLKVPNYQFNAGVAYQLDDKQSIGASWRSVGDMRHHTGNRSSVDGSGVLNLRYGVVVQSLVVDVTLENALDEEVYYPDLALASRVNEVTHESFTGRVWRVEARYRF